MQEDWPAPAVPMTPSEVDLALATIRRRDDWAALFTGAALADAVEPLFGAGWNLVSLRQALVVRPDRSRWGSPPSSGRDAAARWAVWPHPPSRGYELGIAAAAIFNRESEHTARDSWAGKATPGDPLQAVRATKWCRSEYGWAKLGSLTTLSRVLGPWFAAGWCPAAIRWAVEHRPGSKHGGTKAGRPFGDPPRTLDEFTTRLTAWDIADRPPVAGASWQTIVENRRRRIANERINYAGAISDAAQRVERRRAEHDAAWVHKRMLPGARESDARIDMAMYRLDESPRFYDLTEAPASLLDEDLCPCGRYFALPGQRLCSACLNAGPPPR